MSDTVLIDILESVIKSLGTVRVEQSTTFGLPVLITRSQNHYLGPRVFRGILTREEATEAYEQHIEFLDTVGEETIERINELSIETDEVKDYKKILEGIAESEAIHSEIIKRASVKVYVIKAGDEYKIGYSSNPSVRISGVTSPSGNEKELLFTIDNDNPRGLESFLHGVFAHKNISGEWFSLSDVDIEWIKKSIPYLEKRNFGKPSYLTIDSK